MWNKSWRYSTEILICENSSSQKLIKCQTQKIWWQFLTIPGVFARLLSLKSFCKKLKVHKLASDVLICVWTFLFLQYLCSIFLLSPIDTLSMSSCNHRDGEQCWWCDTAHTCDHPRPPLSVVTPGPASVRGNSPIKVMSLITSLPGAGVSPADGMRGIQIAI